MGIWNAKNPWDKDGTSNNDIVILKLKSPLKFNDNVQPACLPDVASFDKARGNKQMAALTGWGLLKDKTGDIPAHLQFVPLPMFPGLYPDQKCGACGTVVFLMACFALVTQLGVRIHAREILVDLWSWQRVMILLSLLASSVMPMANADRKETQESTPKSPSTWTGLRQTWAKIQTIMYIHSCCVEIKP